MIAIPLLSLATIAGSLLGTAPTASAAVADGLFPTTTKPAVSVASSSRAVELGVQFSPVADGTVTALEFYRGPKQTRSYPASLWAADGKLLARTTFPSSTRTGWQTVHLKKPVEIKAGKRYTVSYFSSNGRFPFTRGAFLAPYSRNGLSVGTKGSVYTYASRTALPTKHSRKGKNFFVDVVVNSPATPPPPATPTPTTPPAAAAPTTTPTTPTPTPTTPTPTPTPTPTTPTATATPTSAVTAPSTTGQGGWTLSAASVGLRPLGLSCASLPVYTGPTSVPRGTTLSGVRITSALDLSAGGITIERSCIRPTSVGRGMPTLTTTNYNTFVAVPAKVTIRDSEIDGSALSLELAAWSVGFAGVADLSNNYIHGFGTGINLMFTGTNLDAVVERNYVTGLVAWGDPRTNGNHSDAFTIRDFDATQRAGRSVVVRNNRFDCSSGNDTGAFFIQAYAGRIDNLAVEGNLLEGNGYQLGLESNRYGYGTVTAVNNRFTGTGFGATYVQGGSGWSQWQDNYRYSAVAADGKGTMVTEP